MANAGIKKYSLSGKADPRVFKQGLPMTRQVRKTMQAVLNNESVNSKQIHMMLEVLGFKLSYNGSHKVWRHPKGYRITLSHNKNTTLPPYQLNDVKKLLQEMEVNNEGTEMPIPEADHSLYNPVNDSDFSVKDFYDNKALAERSFKKVGIIDLKNTQQKSITDGVDKGALNSLLISLKGIHTLVLSTQEYLLTMGAELEEAKKELTSIKTSQKKDFQSIYDALIEVKEQYVGHKTIKPEDMLHALTRKSLERAKEALEKHPDFKDNLEVLAVLAKSTPETLQELRAKGLL